MMSTPHAGTGRTIAEVLRHRAATTSDATAFLWLTSDGDESQRLTYADLARHARRVAAALRQVSAPGDRAVLLFAPGIEFLPAFFGCLYAGVVAVPAWPPRPDRAWQGCLALTHLATDCDPAVVLTGGEAAAAIERSCRDIAPLAVRPWINIDLLRGDPSDGWAKEAGQPETLSHIQYTSGTTALPRGVAIDHGNLMHNEHLIASACGHYESAAAGRYGVSWLPFQHDLGLVAGVLQAVFVGGPLVLLSPLTMLQRPAVWLEAISRYRAHTSAGPNFAFDLAVRRLSQEQVQALDLRSWEVCCIGAEPVRTASIDRFTDHFAAAGFRRETFFPSYGLAEATLFVAGGDRNDAPVTVTLGEETGHRRRTLVGCGHAWFDQELQVVDPQKAVPLPDEQIGEVWVAGPSVARGYWNRPDETERLFRASLAGTGDRRWLRTGDLGFVRNGELFLTGRMKDLLIVRGQNHDPYDLEQTILEVDPAFRTDAGAVFQVDRNDEPHLVVVQEIARRAARLDPAELARGIRRLVADRHGVEVNDVVFVAGGSIPKTTSGKIQRHACRSAYEEGRLSIWRPRS